MEGSLTYEASAWNGTNDNIINVGRYQVGYGSKQYLLVNKKRLIRVSRTETLKITHLVETNKLTWLCVYSGNIGLTIFN